MNGSPRRLPIRGQGQREIAVPGSGRAGEPVTERPWARPAPRPRRVFILDDQPVVRAGVRLLLDDEVDLVVVGESASIAEFVAQPAAYDVVVADLILPDASGEQVVAAVRGHAPGANVLILSMVDDVNAAALALRAGAVGYLTKDAAALELVDAVRSVAEGRCYLQPALGAKLATAGLPRDRSAVLGDDELAVLRLLALGHTNAEVARLLGVSLRTVESRRARLFGKLGVRTKAELYRYASDIGLLHRRGLDSPLG
jgi:two-component system response regulator NreC